jgi:methylated-DNA-[protein]-cysteine S-methyltransferase
MLSTYYNSPVGLLRITATHKYVTEVHFVKETEVVAEVPSQMNDVLQQCLDQLIAYFQGQLKTFDIPVQQEGTAFQQSVWSELLNIPYGKTISYLQLAKRLGDPKVIRAAASTNGKNNIAIIVPCHRVIGSNNDLVGYGGGLSRKKWLLEHEMKLMYGVQTLW